MARWSPQFTVLQLSIVLSWFLWRTYHVTLVIWVHRIGRRYLWPLISYFIHPVNPFTLQVFQFEFIHIHHFNTQIIHYWPLYKNNLKIVHSQIRIGCSMPDQVIGKHVSSVRCASTWDFFFWKKILSKLWATECSIASTQLHRLARSFNIRIHKI